MRLVLLMLALSAPLRLGWLLFGCCVVDCQGYACLRQFDPTAASWAAAEASLAVVFLHAASRDPVPMPAVWGALVVLITRAVVDFYGALTLVPALAMGHLADMVVILALTSGWLRAIPDTLRAAREARQEGRGHPRP